MQFMISQIKRYVRWLHTQWPAGHVEKLPLANEDGSTNVAGLYIVGDLTGIPLLKFSSHSGARAVRSRLVSSVGCGGGPASGSIGMDLHRMGATSRRSNGGAAIWRCRTW